MTFRRALVLGAVGAWSWAAAAQVEPCVVFAPEPPPCAKPAAPPAGAVASLDGDWILLSDLDAKVREAVESLETKKAEARRKAVRTEVLTLLVEREAARRKTPAKELRYAEVEARVASPSAAEVDAEIATHAGKYAMNAEWARGMARVNLVNERTTKREEELVARLAKETPVVMGADPSTPGLGPGAVLATVGKRKLTLAELRLVLDTAAARAALLPYYRERGAVEDAVHEKLAKKEAARRGITVEELTKREVADRANGATEGKAREDAEEAFEKSLREGHTVTFLFEEPKVPRQEIATAGSPAKGNPAARVTLVEFGDFQCPPCGQMWPIVEDALKGREESVRYVFRQNPLPIHPFAAKAAEAALAAHAQGKFFAYANLLFTNQKALDVASLKRYAAEAGLDQGRFDRELDAGRWSADVAQEVRDGERHGVLGTPSFFVNGEPLGAEGYTSEGMRAALDRAIAAARK